MNDPNNSPPAATPTPLRPGGAKDSISFDTLFRPSPAGPAPPPFVTLLADHKFARIAVSVAAFPLRPSRSAPTVGDITHMAVSARPRRVPFHHS